MSDVEYFKKRDERSSYRCKAGGEHSGSENSDEEDTPVWRQKQENPFRKQNSSVVVSDTVMSDAGTGSGYAQGSQRKKSNNIWGSVITEQDLTQTLVKSAAVDQPDELSYNERNVESYDFTKKYQAERHGWDMNDSDPQGLGKNSDNFTYRVNSVPTVAAGRSIIGYEDTLDKARDQRDLRHNISKSKNRKRKANNWNDVHQNSRVHDRLGIKKVTTTKLGEIDVSVDMESGLLSAKIAEFLHEPKVELIERIVTHLGKDVAIRILQGTKDVEEGGGIYTLDGSRRRTPGGVYLTLMKQQPEFNKDVRRLIFIEDVQEQMRHRKEKRKKAKVRKKQQAEKQGTGLKDNNNLGSMTHLESKSVSETNLIKKSDKALDIEEEMEDGEIKEETNEDKSLVGKVDRKSFENDQDDGSSDESDYDDNDRQKSTWSKPFNFEDELAETKKLILEKSKSKNNEQNLELMELKCEEGQDIEKDNVSEMADLDTAEADVVEVDIGIDTE